MMGEVFRWLLVMLFGVPTGGPAEAQELDVVETAVPAIEAPIVAPANQACGGILNQGGMVLCLAAPGSAVSVGGVTLTATEDGTAQFGVSRSAPLTMGIESSFQSGDLTISPRADESTTINGIPCDKIDARTPEQKAHAGRSWEKKTKGWASINEGRGALDGFIQPAQGRISSPYGFTRSYVTEGCDTKTKVHWGYDIAAPTGSPIIAPAGGVVTLAESDLYYEGGTVFLDHGHGLVSIFLHMSEVDANVGDVLQAGDPIGKIGATGRVTGPHLHWAVKWRNLSRDDRKGDFYIDPALLLELPRN